ncbi:MAG: MaoC family dehydratase N-terminal domain-containing protein [Rhodobacteraceae bacterium]|nr:MaoC family dehydratase N-terminal domain-containing protein [Paracoccaceae bacterium]
MGSDMDALRKEFLGKTYPKFSVAVERGRIAQFARSIGTDDAVFFDEDAAKQQGYRAIPAPPTFAYSITMDAGQAFNVLEDMGVEKSKAMHGEQGFTYFADICAGDTITGQQKVTDIYDKKNGALIFFVTEMKLENQAGTHVADLHSVIVIRNG